MPYKGRAPFQSAAFVESQRNLTYFDKSLTSGLTDVVINSPGDFLYVDQASTGVVSIELNMRQGGTLAPILLAAGGSIECDFNSFKLNATAQLNKTVRLIVGNGARIKGGANVNASSMSVSVVDGGLARTKQQQAMLGTSSAPAVAAQYPQTQLWNPAASGKNLYLEKISFSSASSQAVQVGHYNAAYASPFTNLFNKYIGQSNGVGLIKYTNNVAILKTELGPAYYCTANQPVSVEYAEPVLIPPGYGFIVIGATVNTNLVTNFEWYEE